jgi:hypothetical protein
MEKCIYLGGDAPSPNGMARVAVALGPLETDLLSYLIQETKHELEQAVSSSCSHANGILTETASSSGGTRTIDQVRLSAPTADYSASHLVRLSGLLQAMIWAVDPQS